MWIEQSRALLTYALDDFTQISRVDLASGTRAVALAAASDPTLLQHGPSSFSRGGRTYAVNYRQITTQLFLVDGLR